MHLRFFFFFCDFCDVMGVYCKASVQWVEGTRRFRKRVKTAACLLCTGWLEWSSSLSLGITHTPKPPYPPSTSLPVSPQVRAP